MRLYLDDLRVPIEPYDFIARSYEEAIKIIEENGVPYFISFDHDLGVDENNQLVKSGYDFAKWLIENDYHGIYKMPVDFNYQVHSQNPVGRKNIIQLMDRYIVVKNQNINKDGKR
ncbi:MAG: hypothetical protein KAJ49_04455 [Arcobacteraceae bacterium]|nr:hypothetical protein [Arcobacteraceae bacterium]